MCFLHLRTKSRFLWDIRCSAIRPTSYLVTWDEESTILLHLFTIPGISYALPYNWLNVNINWRQFAHTDQACATVQLYSANIHQALYYICQICGKSINSVVIRKQSSVNISKTSSFVHDISFALALSQNRIVIYKNSYRTCHLF